MAFQPSQHSNYSGTFSDFVKGKTYSSTDILGLGYITEGNKVVTLQEALANEGYGICQTHTTGSKHNPHGRMESAKPWYTCTWKEGTFDAATKKAVEDFQGDNGLKVDGKAGKNTLTKLGLSVLPSAKDLLATQISQGTRPATSPTGEVSKPTQPAAVAALQKYKWPVAGVAVAGVVGYYVWWKFFKE